MLILLLTALAVTALTIIVHGVGTTQWLRHLTHEHAGRDYRLKTRMRLVVIIQTATLMILLHFIEIMMWAGAFMVVARDELQTFETAVYFSAVTFTTLGYGDITLSTDWRLLSGFEAIGGIVLIGWTTAFLFAVLQRIWDGPGSAQGESKQ
ncbi:MAG TPA: potassium channel family protein [Woeseiaceae bacterium]|nr:potassium channel family protein [Woeseiaceae bacterium]